MKKKTLKQQYDSYKRSVEAVILSDEISAEKIKDLKEIIRKILEFGNQLILQHEKDTESLDHCREEVERSIQGMEAAFKLSKEFEKTVERSMKVIEELKAENQRLYTLLLQK